MRINTKKIILVLFKAQWVYSATLIWFILIFYACLKPASSFPKVLFPHLDKAVHFLMFFIAAILLLASQSLAHHKRKLSKMSLNTFLWVLFIGTGIELLQATPYIERGFEWADILFDVIGGMFGILFFLLFFRKHINYPKNVFEWPEDI